MIKKDDPIFIQSYLEDSSNLKGGFAEGILLPENQKDVIEIVKEFSDKKTPITISAGTTGTTGGCIPFGGWIIGTERLNKIIDIDKKNKTAIIQPAVTLENLNFELKKQGLFYPPDPTETTAFLGGTVATNASGARSFKFGATRNWIRRINVVLSSGEALDIKRGQYKSNSLNFSYFNNKNFAIPNYKMPPVKSSAGYFSKPYMDLIDLFIGSEGTLGIITEIEIDLLKTLINTFDIICFFTDENDCLSFVQEIKRENNILTIEFFDSNSLKLLRPLYPNIPQNATAAIYLESETNGDITSLYLDNWATKLESHKANPEDSWFGINESQKEMFRKFRHNMPELINEEFKKHNTIKLASDIAVPDKNFIKMVDFYNKYIQDYQKDLLCVKFGHIGQNHLHVNLVPKNPESIELAKNILLKFIKKAILFEGTPSAEHGIGKTKHIYLKEMYGENGILEMIRIKKYFDHSCILNQGNIFSKNLLSVK